MTFPNRLFCDFLLIKPLQAASDQDVSDMEVEDEEEVLKEEEAAPPPVIFKRGPGRPKGSKNKIQRMSTSQIIAKKKLRTVKERSVWQKLVEAGGKPKRGPGRPRKRPPTPLGGNIPKYYRLKENTLSPSRATRSTVPAPDFIDALPVQTRKVAGKLGVPHSSESDTQVCAQRSSVATNEMTDKEKGIHKTSVDGEGEHKVKELEDEENVDLPCDSQLSPQDSDKALTDNYEVEPSHDLAPSCEAVNKVDVQDAASGSSEQSSVNETCISTIGVACVDTGRDPQIQTTTQADARGNVEKGSSQNTIVMDTKEENVEKKSKKRKHKHHKKDKLKKRKIDAEGSSTTKEDRKKCQKTEGDISGKLKKHSHHHHHIKKKHKKHAIGEKKYKKDKGSVNIPPTHTGKETPSEVKDGELQEKKIKKHKSSDPERKAKKRKKIISGDKKTLDLLASEKKSKPKKELPLDLALQGEKESAEIIAKKHRLPSESEKKVKKHKHRAESEKKKKKHKDHDEHDKKLKPGKKKEKTKKNRKDGASLSGMDPLLTESHHKKKKRKKDKTKIASSKISRNADQAKIPLIEGLKKHGRKRRHKRPKSDNIIFHKEVKSDLPYMKPLEPSQSPITNLVSLDEVVVEDFLVKVLHQAEGQDPRKSTPERSQTVAGAGKPCHPPPNKDKKCIEGGGASIKDVANNSGTTAGTDIQKVVQTGISTDGLYQCEGVVKLRTEPGDVSDTDLSSFVTEGDESHDGGSSEQSSQNPGSRAQEEGGEEEEEANIHAPDDGQKEEDSNEDSEEEDEQDEEKDSSSDEEDEDEDDDEGGDGQGKVKDDEDSDSVDEDYDVDDDPEVPRHSDSEAEDQDFKYDDVDDFVDNDSCRIEDDDCSLLISSSPSSSSSSLTSTEEEESTIAQKCKDINTSSVQTNHLSKSVSQHDISHPFTPEVKVSPSERPSMRHNRVIIDDMVCGHSQGQLVNSASESGIDLVDWKEVERVFGDCEGTASVNVNNETIAADTALCPPKATLSSNCFSITDWDTINRSIEAFTNSPNCIPDDHSIYRRKLKFSQDTLLQGQHLDNSQIESCVQPGDSLQLPESSEAPNILIPLSSVKHVEQSSRGLPGLPSVDQLLEACGDEEEIHLEVLYKVSEETSEEGSENDSEVYTDIEEQEEVYMIDEETGQIRLQNRTTIQKVRNNEYTDCPMKLKSKLLEVKVTTPSVKHHAETSGGYVNHPVTTAGKLITGHPAFNPMQDGKNTWAGRRDGPQPSNIQRRLCFLHHESENIDQDLSVSKSAIKESNFCAHKSKFQQQAEKEHLSAGTRETKATTPAVPLECPYECGICGLTFNTTSALKTHVATHPGTKPRTSHMFKCAYCSRSTTRAASLRNHLRTHTKERPHTCKWCTLAFSDLSNLRKHERIHLGIMPFQCENCGRKFRRRDNVSQHICVGDVTLQS